MKRKQNKPKNPRNWHAVNAHQRTSAGPMKDKKRDRKQRRQEDKESTLIKESADQIRKAFKDATGEIENLNLKDRLAQEQKRSEILQIHVDVLREQLECIMKFLHEKGYTEEEIFPLLELKGN